MLKKIFCPLSKELYPSPKSVCAYQKSCILRSIFLSELNTAAFSAYLVHAIAEFTVHRNLFTRTRWRRKQRARPPIRSSDSLRFHRGRGRRVSRGSPEPCRSHPGRPPGSSSDPCRRYAPLRPLRPQYCRDRRRDVTDRSVLRDSPETQSLFVYRNIKWREGVCYRAGDRDCSIREAWGYQFVLIASHLHSESSIWQR